MYFKLTLIILLLINLNLLLAQPVYELAWSNAENAQIDPFTADCIRFINLECQKVRLDSQEDVVVSGTSNEEEELDILVAKYDNNGNVRWKQLLNLFTGSLDLLIEMRIDENDDILLLTYSLMPDNAHRSQVIKLSADGELIWEYLLLENFVNVIPENLVMDADGATYITGTISAGINSRVFVCKLTAEGDLAWEDTDGDEEVATNGATIRIVEEEVIALGSYGSGFDLSERGFYVQKHSFSGERLESYQMGFQPNIRSLHIGSLGDYYVGELNDFKLTKFNSVGEEEWVFSIPTNLPDNLSADVINHIITDEEGDVYITGNHHGEEYGNPNVYTNADLQVVKLSPDGNLLYSYRYEYSGDNTIESGNRLSLGPDNEVLVGGTSQRMEEGVSTYEYLAIVLNSSGLALDTLRYASEMDAVVKSVVLDDDLNIYLTGTASGSTLTRKYNFNAPTGLEELIQSGNGSVYPNPCNDQFTVAYANYGQTYDLKLFTENGKLLFHRSDCTATTQVVDVKNLPAGIYYYQLISFAGIISGKVVKQVPR